MTSLLQTIYNNSHHLLEEIKVFIDRGEDLNFVTEYGESPLRVASNNGRLDVVWLLLENGADGKQLEWTPTFHEVAFGDLDSIRESVRKNHDLEARDFWNRTPWLLSLMTGSIEKASLLLEMGADRTAVGHCGKTPMVYSIQKNDTRMLAWLIEQGFDIEAADEFNDTPIFRAAETGFAECVKILLDAGADIYKNNNIPERPIQVTSSLDVAMIFVEAGDDINDISEDVHAALLGIEVDGSPTVTRKQYLEGKYRQFGSANPQLFENPFWDSMIRCGASAWKARNNYNDDERLFNDNPVWSYQRFGRTLNRLPDGRIIEIAGEHEDSYDPDFCIYNDVVVFYPDNHIEIYGYPENIFPPTDFHTATLVGDVIYIIGRLGYASDRKAGVTPVYKLDINSCQVEKVETTGSRPGWIYKHKARYDGSHFISLSGGVIMQDRKKSIKNDRVYTLDLNTMEWSV